MKAVSAILCCLFLIACESDSEEGDGVPWLEKQVFNIAFSWGCESTAEDDGITEVEAERRCDCMKDTLEKELTTEEWRQLIDDSQNTEEGGNLEVLERLQPQFNACLSPQERELESESKGKA